MKCAARTPISWCGHATQRGLPPPGRRSKTCLTRCAPASRRRGREMLVIIIGKRSGGRYVAVTAMAGMLSMVLLIATTAVQAASLQGVGVVFLHGKGVWAGAFDGGIPAALEAEGAVAVSPEMPWSLTRIYGATYEEAMQEIDAAVAGLKGRGARRIIIIGHSLGANAAIGYAASRHEVAAVGALSPGHLPGTAQMRAPTADAIKKARALVVGGEKSPRLPAHRGHGLCTVP